jgi:hypothetical protein
MAYDWGQGLKGAGGGALAGASVGGPAGAVIGGGVGLLSGFFGNKESDNEQNSRKMLEDYYRNVQDRQPLPGVTAQTAGTSDVRGRQLGLADHLTAMSKGQGPSLAEAQLRSATDRSAAHQAGAAASGRGGPMAAQQAANNMMRLDAQGSQDAATARIQEQQMALQQLGLTLHGTRSADEETSRFNAGQQNDVAMQNMLARLKQMGMKDDASLQIISQLQGQNGQVAGRAGLGDSVLAGGAGMYAMGVSQKAGSQAAQTSMPTGVGGINSYWRNKLQG